MKNTWENPVVEEEKADRPQGRCFTFFVDDQQFTVERPKVTGLEILNLAGIPLEVGLLLILDDGTQRIVEPNEVIHLANCRRFKKAPRFKRGWE
jgi:hypothetical protein